MVVIEISRSYLRSLKGSEWIESLKIVHMLSFGAGGFSGICKLKLRDPRGDVRGLVGSLGMTKVKPISKEKDGSELVYVEGRPMEHWMRVASPRDGYQYPPFELRDKTWRKTFLGSEGQIRKILERTEKAGLKFRIVWAGEARFTPNSLASGLTESQRRTLSTAYRNGYYDFPRKIGSEKLAATLGLSKSTVSEHLRKAEKSVLDQVLAD